MKNQPTILVIDDDPGIRVSLCVLLRAEGLEVHEACDGEKGVALFREVNPDVVICDLIMPGLHGYQTITEIKRMNLQVKIIAMSGGTKGGGQIGTTPEAMLSWSSQFGADVVLVKPFEPSVLLREVLDLIPKTS